MDGGRDQSSAAHIDRALIEKAYRCAAEPALWGEFLQDVVGGMASRSARILLLNADASEVLSSVKHNIDDAFHAGYVSHFVNECPWRPELGRLPPGRVYSSYLHFSCSQDEFYRTGFFNDWAGPQDIHHGLLGTIWKTPEACVQLLVQRTEGQGPFLEEDLRRVNDLVPHLKQVFRLAQQFGALRAESGAALRAARLKPAPFVLVGADGRVAYVSEDAETLLERQREVGLRHGRLSFEGANAAEVRRLLREALASPANGWTAAGGTVRLGGGDITVCVMPVHPETRFPEAGQAYAAVFFYEARPALKLCPETLAKLYGFSRAEASVAEALMLGRNSRDISQVRGVSFNTVRTQVAAMLRKTGCASQADLVRVLLAGPALIRG